VRRILKELKENSSKLNIKVMVIHMAVFALTIVSLVVYIIFAATFASIVAMIPENYYIPPDEAIQTI
jgi:hypothetical protein